MKSLSSSSSDSRNSFPATELCIFIFRKATPSPSPSDSLSPVLSHPWLVSGNGVSEWWKRGRLRVDKYLEVGGLAS